MEIKNIIKTMVNDNATDIFIVPGKSITYKKNGKMYNLTEKVLSPNDSVTIIHSIYDLADNRNMDKFIETGDDDFAFSIKGLARFRANIYKQRGSFAAVLRVINYTIPDPLKLGIKDEILNVASIDKGLVLVTGSAGSGKSTTLACIIDCINENRQSHIITLEDPLEYIHHHKKSIVSQREISCDTINFITALRATLRQSPDVVLIGELRDYETMGVAMTAAETGHLILSSLHTVGAANSIDRIVDSFPANQQQQILLQLSMVLKVVISQVLIPTIDGELVPIFEIMVMTPAIKNLIREGKIHQLDNVISTSSLTDGMISIDQSILELYNAKRITKDTALLYSTNPELMKKKL